eukprot:UN03318
MFSLFGIDLNFASLYFLSTSENDSKHVHTRFAKVLLGSIFVNAKLKLKSASPTNRILRHRCKIVIKLSAFPFFPLCFSKNSMKIFV